MQEKLVSIIMPVHNSEKYIKQALESVKKQIYQNYEIIIIDDNSKDKTLEIIQKADINKEKIKIIRLKRHRGVAIARNVGIRNASGRYIAFLDSDDIWKTDKLKKQIEFIKDKCFIYSSYRYINNNCTKMSSKVKVLKRTDYEKALSNCRILTTTTMIDLKKIPKRYCYMPDIMIEDYATWLKLLRKGHIADGQNEVLAYYRKSPKSRSANKFNTAHYRWKLYKEHEGLSGTYLSFCFYGYMINGILKRIKIYTNFRYE